MTTFPTFPRLDSKNGEYAFAEGYLEAAIRNLHDRLSGLRSHEALCEDLRQIPIALGRALDEYRSSE